MAKVNPELLGEYLRAAGCGGVGELLDSGMPENTWTRLMAWCALDALEQVMALRKAGLRDCLLATARADGRMVTKGGSMALGVGDGGVMAKRSEKRSLNAAAVLQVAVKAGVPDKDLGKWVFKPDRKAMAKRLSAEAIAECEAVVEAWALDVIPPTPTAP